MNTPLNNLVIYNGYPLSIAVALVIHIMIFLTLLYLQSASEAQSLELVQPTVIKALFIDENPQLRNQQLREQRRVEQVEQQRRQEQQRQEAERLSEKCSNSGKQSSSDWRGNKWLFASEKSWKGCGSVPNEKSRSVLKQNPRDVDSKKSPPSRNGAQRRRQQELAEASAAEAARTEFELVQSATALIQQAVQETWSRPPSARNGMRAVLQIRMLPTGEVLDAVITQSSGDPAFDRSAENALYRAAPFRELQSLPINVFNANFRSLSLIFEPEDLLN